MIPGYPGENCCKGTIRHRETTGIWRFRKRNARQMLKCGQMTELVKNSFCLTFKS